LNDAAIWLRSVDVTYPNGVIALRGVDLAIAPGERVALVGPSGGGKTTLLSLINGRLDLDGARVDGEVSVLGTDPRRLGERARRRWAARIGAVRQGHDLVGPMRVVHNVNGGRLAAWTTPRALWSLISPLERDDAAAALDAVGLSDSLLDARVDELSGGQRQRVAVARMLRQRPEVVLADEPVASLDPGLSARVIELLAAPPAAWAPSGWTSVVSLHQPDLARRVAPRAVGIRDGQVAFDIATDALGDDALESLYAP